MGTLADADPEDFTEGRDQYVNFAEKALNLRLAETQKRILRALTEHNRILVVSGNGVGKSYTVAIAKLAFLATNPDSIVLGTSGSYSQFVDAAWRPLKSLHEDAKRRVGIPGETYDGGQPTLEIDEEWFAKVVSPRDPGDLEGRHAAQMLVVIEEADKQYITREHFDSAGSSVTDADDRMLAVANPPLDETDVVAEKMASDRWHTIQFSSFESHNVQADAGKLDAEHIPGLVDLGTLKADWEEWNGQEWPGFEQARTAHERRTDLDERWYRRRAGVIPPDGAATHRPFYPDDVTLAVDENEVPRDGVATSAEQLTGPPVGIGIDVARKGGDSTVVCKLFETHATFDVWSHFDHTENESRISSLLDQYKGPIPTAIDAVGEGSALADRLRELYPVHRFKSGTKPDTDDAADEYYDKWTEGLDALGDRLRKIGIDQRGETRIRKELYAAARVVTIEEQLRRSGDIIKATPKSEIKERLGWSPDSLDALVMAAWAAGGNAELSKTIRRRSGGSPSKGNLR